MTSFDWPGVMNSCPPRYPKEFRDNVVKFAVNRDPEVTLTQPYDCGIHVTKLDKWIREEYVEQEQKPGITRSENVELRRATAYLSLAHLPGKGSTRS